MTLESFQVSVIEPCIFDGPGFDLVKVNSSNT